MFALVHSAHFPSTCSLYSEQSLCLYFIICKYMFWNAHQHQSVHTLKWIMQTGGEIQSVSRIIKIDKDRK